MKHLLYKSAILLIFFFLSCPFTSSISLKSYRDIFSEIKSNINSSLHSSEIIKQFQLNIPTMTIPLSKDASPTVKDVLDLSESELEDPIEESEAVNASTCSKDKGFGIDGTCLSQLFSSTANSAPLPSESIKQKMGWIYEILFKSILPFDLCYGDYAGETVEKNWNLKNMKCDGIPLMEEFKYGYIGAYVNNVPCGTPQTVNFCVTFDQCGTFAIALNGGMAQCAATYSTGIAAIVSPVAEVFDYLSFGFSYKRRFTQTFTIAYRNGENVNSKEITTYGHFLIGLGFSTPLEFIKIDNKSISDIFSLDLDTKFIVDLGNAASTIDKFINQIQNVNKENTKNLIDAIMNQGAELTIQVAGTFSINLNDLTRGFIDNMEFNIGSAAILVSMGGSNNASGMNTGFYIYFTMDNVLNLGSIYSRMWMNFAAILDKIGLPKIPFPKVGASLGIFIQSDSVGFEFKLSQISLKCMYIYSSKKGSCDFNNKVFTAIIDGAKWVIKEAGKFFESTGKEIVNFSKDVGGFAENSASAVAKVTKQAAEEVARKTQQAAEEVARKTQQAAEEVARKTQQAAEEVARKTQQAAEDARRIAQQAAEEVARKTQQAAEDAKRFAQQAAEEVARKTQQAAEDAKRFAEQTASRVRSFFSGW
jgi:hypothetical protein